MAANSNAHVILVLSQVARNLSLLPALRDKLRMRRIRKRKRERREDEGGAEEEEGEKEDDKMVVVAGGIIPTWDHYFHLGR